MWRLENAINSPAFLLPYFPIIYSLRGSYFRFQKRGGRKMEVSKSLIGKYLQLRDHRRGYFWCLSPAIQFSGKYVYIDITCINPIFWRRTLYVVPEEEGRIPPPSKIPATSWDMEMKFGNTSTYPFYPFVKKIRAQTFCGAARAPFWPKNGSKFQFLKKNGAMSGAGPQDLNYFVTGETDNTTAKTPCDKLFFRYFW